MTIREITEKIEAETLSQYAALASRTRGRLHADDKCDIRTEFQRDRDRIIHSKAFRRLKHKTQVFITPEGDHYRTRLTHTLEVMQIARTIARALRLNEDLTEAIALGHDLGHTPFGHVGEKVLNEICPGGFRHFEQSLRVVDVLEDGKGINLTYEVRDGILNHTGEHQASTLEGKIVKYADRFAYINHDIDDAIRGAIIRNSDIPAKCRKILGEKNSQRINTLICDIVSNSQNKPELCMSDEVSEAMAILRQFMFDNVYVGSEAKKEEAKAVHIIEQMFVFFLKHEDKLPQESREQIEKYGLERVICDYIAGMSDGYAIYKFNELFVPKSWAKR
ncbi:MAG: deoxyguanosinetriphosphate triphosphohydrolase [Clostridia bacterium]|nr:deoxyguanosinetriphosphate triphosphohydrolase [Clostridia bacterium]